MKDTEKDKIEFIDEQRMGDVYRDEVEALRNYTKQLQRECRTLKGRLSKMQGKNIKDIK